MSLALATLLTLAPTTPIPPQGPDVPTVLVRTGETLPVNGQPSTVQYVGTPRTGVGGGWTVNALIDAVPASAIIGQRPSGIGGPVEVLRTPQTLHGYTQGGFGGHHMANGDLAYLTHETNAAVTTGVWLDDQLLLRAGEPLVGHAGLTWYSFINLAHSTSGRVLVVGLAQSSPGVFHQALVELPSKHVLLAAGDPVPGVATPLQRFGSPIASSSDGSHWAIVGRFEPNGRRVVLVDGAVHTFGSGEAAMAALPVPATFAAVGATRWQEFHDLDVTDDGRVSFLATRDSVGESFSMIVRDDHAAAFSANPDELEFAGMDERGIVVGSSRTTDEASIERRTVPFPTTEVDVDRDGTADPGWSAVNQYLLAGPDQQALMVMRTILRRTSGQSYGAIVRIHDLRFDRPVCDGVVNSSGGSSHMVVGGNSTVAANDVVLQAYQVPPTSVGYFLVSDTPGFTTQPAGSQGNLCLSGGIGRMTGQLFVAGPTGQVSATFDTSAVPRPMGSIAAAAGSTWFTQAWFRDSIGGLATSNFSGAVSFTFE